MKIMNIGRKYGAKAAVVFAAPLALATQAWAAVPEAVKTELGTAKADATEVGGLILAIVVVLFAFGMLRRQLH